MSCIKECHLCLRYDILSYKSIKFGPHKFIVIGVQKKIHILQGWMLPNLVYDQLNHQGFLRYITLTYNDYGVQMRISAGS